MRKAPDIHFGIRRKIIRLVSEVRFARLMAAVGRHERSGRPRRLSLVECNAGETGHHG